MNKKNTFEDSSSELDIVSSFQKFTQRFQNQSFLLAVSGGVDSVVLCHLFKSFNLTFHIAHINFQLREEESMRDEKFVQSLAEAFNIPIHIQRVNTQQIAQEKKMAIQEVARKIRYNYFEQWRQEFHLHKIVTAHHFDDNVETILFRLLRGTGLKGLLGIPVENGNIIRPLLDFSKKDILEYAHVHHLDFVEDSSNSKDKYARNWIRLQLIPLLEQQFPNFKSNIKNHLPFLQQTHKFYIDHIQHLLHRKIAKTPQGHRISIAFLQNSPYSHILFFELLLRYDFVSTQIAELQKLAFSKNGSYMQNEKFRIVKYDKNFLISSFDEAIFYPLIIPQNTDHIDSVFHEKLVFKYTEKSPSLFTKNLDEAYIDVDNIQFPLVWRKYKTGDYFYPLGMSKKKKIARFLIDQKINLLQKERITVLEDAQKKIIWIVGYRIDDRCKIKPTTKHLLKIERKTC